MLTVQYVDGRFFMFWNDGSGKMISVDGNYKFTEDIYILLLFGDLGDMGVDQFTNAKIKHVGMGSPDFACKLLKHKPDIKKINVTISDTLENFVAINNIDEEISKKVRIEVVVYEIPGLTSEHFTNRYIHYTIHEDFMDNRVVCENAKCIIFENDDPLDNVDFRKCEYDCVGISPYNINTKKILESAVVRKIVTRSDSVNEEKFDAFIDTLSRTKIQEVVIINPAIIAPIGTDLVNPVTDIDSLLLNPNIEKLQIRGDRDVTYTEEVLKQNMTIKELTITGPRCDQELIARVCESNRRRCFRTKSART